MSYQEYFEGLQKEKEALQKKAKTALSQELLQAKQAGDGAKQQAIEIKIEEAIKDIDRKFAGAIDQLVLSYDSHMKKIMPKPKLLPIRVNIAIECKQGLKIENIHVKPYETVNDLFKIVEEFQASRGDPVLSWNKAGIKVLLTGPLHGAGGVTEEEKKD